MVAGAAGSWEARAGGGRIGSLRALVRPDRRCHLAFRDCRADAYPPLLARATAELDRDLYTRADEPELDRLTALGFQVRRRERRYRIPVAQARSRVPAIGPPPGIDLVSAADADLDRLRLLDDALRQEIPGADGWRWIPEEFREETFSEGFDPATYLVAVAHRTGDHVGLVRVWLRPDRPRLGCLGVLPAYRRTRVTAALLGTALSAVDPRRYPALGTEIDATNHAADALARRCGAVLTGDSHELILHRRAPGDPAA